MDRDELEKKWPVLAFFKYEHLPVALQELSKPIGDLAFLMAERLAASASPAEVAVGLRKLLEAKDCLVRAKLAASGQPIRDPQTGKLTGASTVPPDPANTAKHPPRAA